MKVKNEQLDLDMDQLTDSKLGKELTKMYILIYKMPAWMNNKLEKRFPGEISIT